jgi:antitoxin YefM
MREITVHKFRSHLRQQVEEVVEDHVPLRVKRRGGQDFVVVSAEDWEREQETLYILQNKSLMKQVERSLKTHRKDADHLPSLEPESPNRSSTR